MTRNDSTVAISQPHELNEALETEHDFGGKTKVEHLLQLRVLVPLEQNEREKQHVAEILSEEMHKPCEGCAVCRYAASGRCCKRHSAAMDPFPKYCQQQAENVFFWVRPPGG